MALTDRLDVHEPAAVLARPCLGRRDERSSVTVAVERRPDTQRNYLAVGVARFAQRDEGDDHAAGPAGEHVDALCHCHVVFESLGNAEPLGEVGEDRTARVGFSVDQTLDCRASRKAS